MRLIDADALVYTMLYGGRGCTPLMLTPKTIADAPTVDAVEVVRCKDCEREAYCGCTQYQGENGYCSLGERRGD